MPRALIVIPAALQPHANAATKAMFDPSGGEQTFLRGLVPIDAASAAVPTHYWCCANFDRERWNALGQIRRVFPTAYIRRVDLDTDPEAAERILGELGLRRVVEG
jgi:hypothetical protein